MSVTYEEPTLATVSPGTKMSRPIRIWIDIDNSPHVPFFIPIIEELQKSGAEVIVTARDAYQVRDLMELRGMSGQFVGRH